MAIIIKSRVKGEEHWEGKGFMPKYITPAVYSSIQEAASFMATYWSETAKQEYGWHYDDRDIIFVTVPDAVESTKKLKRLVNKYKKRQ